jgi:O-antigen/teichoic acid export membrane protein
VILKIFNSLKISKSSVIFFIGTLIGSFFHYLYTIAMGRLLGPSDYGAFSSLLSLIFIVIFPLGTFQTVITKYTAGFLANNNFSGIRYISFSLGKHALIYGILASFLFLLLSNVIKNALNIYSITPILILSSIPLFFSILPLTRGVLQGTLKFTSLGLNLIVEGFGRFISGCILVYFGTRVSGAIAATPISGMFAFILSIPPIFFIYKSKNKIDEKINFWEVYKYLIPVFITQLCMTVLPFGDLVIVKRYFSSYDAGIYAGAQTIGKIIYFFSTPISMILFPRAAFLKERGESVKKIFIKGLTFTILGCSILFFFYLLFPKFIVLFMFGEKYRAAIPYLKFFGISMSFLSLVYMFSFFQLSLGKTKFVIPLFIMTILQVVLMVLFHPTLESIICIIIFCSFILCIINTFLIIRTL